MFTGPRIRLADSTALSRPALIRARTTDAMTFDRATVDSAGAFLIGELERLDPTLHKPLVSFKWSRDIDLREDVSIADEISSFTNSTFAAVGGVNPNGKGWIGKDSSAIASLALDIGKTPNPLHLWGMQVGWTIPELASAQQLGRPVDQQKIEALQLKWNMDIDEQVYIGDTTLANCYGLFNNVGLNPNTGLPNVVPTNVVNGASGSPLWSQKTQQEILNDVNTALYNPWLATGYSFAPGRLMLPPKQFAQINAQILSQAGSTSTLKFLGENNISLAENGQALEIYSSKWLTGRGVGGTDRMVVYTKRKDLVRFPMVPLQRTPVEYRDLRQLMTYYGRLGQVEMPYPETVAYIDGI